MNQKEDFLGNAAALLFPIDWPEPFGLVMIEAMACGVPTVAWRNGSVPEVIEDGVTGFIVESMDEAVRAVERVTDFDRGRCRRAFEERFSARRMAEDYMALYERILRTPSAPAPGDGRVGARPLAPALDASRHPSRNGRAGAAALRDGAARPDHRGHASARPLP